MRDILDVTYVIRICWKQACVRAAINSSFDTLLTAGKCNSFWSRWSLDFFSPLSISSPFRAPGGRTRGRIFRRYQRQSNGQKKPPLGLQFNKSIPRRLSSALLSLRSLECCYSKWKWMSWHSILVYLNTHAPTSHSLHPLLNSPGSPTEPHP